MTTLPTRLDLIKLLPQGAQLAEIGVYRGEFAKQMLDLPTLGHLYLVDPWQRIPGYRDPVVETDPEDNYERTLANLRGHLNGGRVTIYRETSLMASQRIAPAQLDGAYIDADHSFAAVFYDLNRWSSRLKPEALLMGHDFVDNDTSRKYGWGVIQAVEAFCKASDWRMEYLTIEEYPSFGLRRSNVV